jgi:uncharacterized protein (DUF924 family)
VSNGAEPWTEQVLGYWLGLGYDRWFRADPAVDEEVRTRFLDLWSAKRTNPPDRFLGSPREALAAVVLFDQLSRNMMRGHADQFSTDPLALAIAKGAIARGFDAQLGVEERGLLYMPFQHSEDLDDQRQSVLLFTRLGHADMARFAQLHHDVVARFGRFPHRNAVLGRTPRPDEIAAGNVTPFG